MDIDFNPRDNGACPLCSLIGSCPIRRAMRRSLEEIPDPSGAGMETVIYSCPLFKEN